MKTQTINVDIKKTTIQTALSQLKMLKKLDFQQAQKGDPFYDLVMEIKRDIKRNKMTDKEAWIEFLQFWPLSIVVPGMLILILCANWFQW